MSAEKRAARKAARLEKWPDTDGVAPWKIEAKRRAGIAAKALAAVALDAVKEAAKLAIKGALKHNAAVAVVVAATGVDEDKAIDAVFAAFDKHEDSL